jgi:Pao retrotransposon peptidase
LNTLTFGVKSSPFLSLRVIKQLCIDESHSFSDVILPITRDMYMDDFVSSFLNVQEAIIVHRQLVSLFDKGGFQIVKWMSNSDDFLSNVPESLQLVQIKTFDKASSKVLGLQWERQSDKFNFGPVISINDSCTKRNILSVVARMFDPLGFLSPLTLSLKIWIKRLWELKIDWDMMAPKEFQIQWNKFQDEISVLQKIEIPRSIVASSTSSLSLIGFADASAAG